MDTRFIMTPLAVFSKIRAVPGRWSSIVLPWFFFFLVIFAYQTASTLRHIQNPDDRFLPSIPTILYTMGELTVLPVEYEDMEAAVYDEETGEVLQQKYFTTVGRRDDSGRHMLLRDLRTSGTRFFIALGFLAIAAFLGLHMGTLPYVNLLFEKSLLFFDKISVMAILPILLIFLGLGEEAKITLIVIGVFPQIALDAKESAGRVPREQKTLAFTRAASDLEIIWLVVHPQMFHSVLDAFRLNFKTMITLLLISETYGATSGMGYRIFKVIRFKQLDVILCYVIILAVLTFGLDFLFQLWKRRSKWQTA